MKFSSMMLALYATYLTNRYGLILKYTRDSQIRKKLRYEYSQKLLNKLNIHIEVSHSDKLPKDGQVLLISNHRSIIDPIIIETALFETKLFGNWVAKKELYNSFFFGLFTRNAGTILLDRQADQMSGFFKDIKTQVAKGDSIFVFPEGTRNKAPSGIAEFKDGSRIIALKNKLPILPVYIKNQANDILKAALNDPKTPRTITVVIGDLIDYKDKSPLETTYRKMFDL